MNDIDDRELFTGLRGMWERRDPVPAGLVDDVLVALAALDLAAEYELLTLVSDSVHRQGARAETGARVLEFAHSSVSVMLRVSELDDGTLRIDGWTAPARPGSVRFEREAGEASAPVAADGRFEFSGLRPGATRLTLVPDDGAGFTTDSFTL
ncbi:MAG: hypothetical protein JWN36_3032 [Microbacteriaceae bacterium]|nr:hypothetical protein [Microbacteriaceae bacterium]